MGKRSLDPSVLMKQEQPEQQVRKHPDDNGEHTAGLRPNQFKQTYLCFLIQVMDGTDAGEAAAATQLDSGGM